MQYCGIWRHLRLATPLTDRCWWHLIKISYPCDGTALVALEIKNSCPYGGTISEEALFGRYRYSYLNGLTISRKDLRHRYMSGLVSPTLAPHQCNIFISTFTK